MKIIVLLFCSLLLLPFAFSKQQLPKSLLTPPVISEHGQLTEINRRYYVIADLWIPQGLCRLDHNNYDNQCSHNVVMCPLSRCPIIGFSIVFTPVLPQIDNILHENTPYYIKFSANCSHEAYWSLTAQKFISTNPLNPPTQFQVQKSNPLIAPPQYRIVHCPVIQINPHAPVCYPLGFIRRDGYDRLGTGIGFNQMEAYFKNDDDTVV